MYFTVSKKKETFKDTTSAVRLLESMSQRVPSTIDLRLDQILRKYQADLERQKERKSKNSFWSNHKDVKPLSLYVFTDGAWEGCDAVAPIEAMIEKQTELKLPRTQVGIQFIRFGEDPRGKVKLQYLDSGLRKKHGKEQYVFFFFFFQNFLPFVSSGLYVDFVYVVLVILSIRSRLSMGTCWRCFLPLSSTGTMMTTMILKNRVEMVARHSLAYQRMLDYYPLTYQHI